MMHPYEGAGFFKVIALFLMRMGLWLTGSITSADLAPDEWQILALICMGISASWVGTFLVIRRSAMIAGALSHTMLLGIVLAVFLLGPLGLATGDFLDINVPVLLL